MNNNILIIEDDEILSKAIKERLIDIESVVRVDVVSTIKEAERLLQSSIYNFFVVDINLPDGNGHRIIEAIRNVDVRLVQNIVVITGVRETTSEILELINTHQCQLYFQKPVILDELYKSVATLCSKRVPEKSGGRLKVRRKKADMYFDYDSIIYIETNNKITTIKCLDGEVNIGRYALSKLEEQLPENRFIRIHRAFVINKNFISHIEKIDNQHKVKLNLLEEALPVGSSYRKILADSVG